MASERLAPFTASWNIASQKRLASLRLFYAYADDPKARYKHCRFQQPDGKTVELPLNWRPISFEEFLPRIRRLGGFIQPKHELSSWGAGWWIRLNTLVDEAAPVTAEIERRAGELRQAPFVVLDLRSNVGGAADYAIRIATALFGNDAVNRAIKKMNPTELPDVWRVSTDNLALLDEFIVRFTAITGAQSENVVELKAQAKAMRAAMAEGRSLSTIPPAASASTTPSKGIEKVRAPRVILLTDHVCFSSCIYATELFRDLGALQVGEETSADSSYINVRTIDLPSGLAMFSTMTGYTPSPSKVAGPFTPSIEFRGNMADDDAVRAWISGIVADKLKRPKSGRTSR